MKSTVISPTGQKIAGETVQNDYPSEWAEQWQVMTNKVFPMGFISLSTEWFFGAFPVLVLVGFGWFFFFWSALDLISRFVDEQRLMTSV